MKNKVPKKETQRISSKSGTTMNVLFCGTGGQGVLTAAELCGWAALYDGYHVKKSEVHGMAQRGGSVESHLRFGKTVYSPLIPVGAVDVLVSFHADEHARMKHFLKANGKDLLPFLAKSEELVPEKKYRNTFLLGVLAKFLSLSEESWMKALERTFKEKNLGENKAVFLQGKRMPDDLE